MKTTVTLEYEDFKKIKEKAECTDEIIKKEVDRQVDIIKELMKEHFRLNYKSIKFSIDNIIGMLDLWSCYSKKDFKIVTEAKLREISEELYKM